METRRCHLDNGNAPQEPALTEAEKADTQGFMKEILQILPLVGLRAFEFPIAVAAPLASDPLTGAKPGGRKRDTIIVPAKKDGFEVTFLGEDCWYAIRISGGMLDKIKYIAAYQTKPVSAITHYAPVSRIEPYGEGGKYKVVFSGSAKPIGPFSTETPILVPCRARATRRSLACRRCESSPKFWARTDAGPNVRGLQWFGFECDSGRPRSPSQSNPEHREDRYAD